MEQNNIVKPVNTSPKMPLIIAGGVGIILIGFAVGWFFSSKKSATKISTSIPAITVSENEAGVNDPSTISNVTTATGTLTLGGIRGEGAYHIVRPGGATQTVYLNSTTIDMSHFVGKKVQVWGQTLSAHYAPWLMDVMKIKVVQ